MESKDLSGDLNGDIKIKSKVIIKSKAQTPSVDEITKYIEGLNPLEKIAYDIAKTRLKTSFDIEKSIGYKSSH